VCGSLGGGFFLARAKPMSKTPKAFEPEVTRATKAGAPLTPKMTDAAAAKNRGDEHARRSRNRRSRRGRKKTVQSKADTGLLDLGEMADQTFRGFARTEIPHVGLS